MAYTSRIGEGYHDFFAKNLRLLMEEKKTTQKELANYLGVSPQAVGAYCRGETLPSIEYARKIADFFGVSMDFMAGRIEIRTPNISVQAIHEETGLSEKTINILRMWKSCKDPMLGYCTDFVDDLLSYDNISSIVWTLRVYRGAVEEGKKEKVAKEYAKVGEILGGSLEDCLKMKNREISEARLSAILEYEQFMNK